MIAAWLPTGVARMVGVALVVLAAGCGWGEPAPEPGPDTTATEREQPTSRPVALVTGSTAGLGRAVALALADRGMHVIVHGRDEERGRAVVAEILGSGRGSATLELADFASLDEVVELAERIGAQHDQLALLVNNAGIGPGAPGHERVLTQDGNELRFQVNYLAGYLLARELLPLLESAAGSGQAPRIVNVASRSQQPIDFDDLTMDRGYRGGVAYGRSKLAQIIDAFVLAEELQDTGILVYAVHPAPAMDTGLVRATGGTPQSTVEDGLDSVLRVLTEPGLPTGTYHHEEREARAHDQAYDADARRRLIQASERLLEDAGISRPDRSRD